MTYCLGILLPQGLVLASDSRSNAGVDQVQEVCKLALITHPGSRVIAILSQGNLATTQSVVSQVRQAAGSGDVGEDVFLARTMFDVAGIVGAKLRQVIEQDGKFVAPYGDAAASFLVGGQIAGEPPRLFEIYAAGNFVEATRRACFQQIGETKYGKPIIVRAYDRAMSFAEATKLLLVSFDSTLKSNLSVGLPLDLLFYEKDSLKLGLKKRIGQDDPYYRTISDGWSNALKNAFKSLPDFSEG